MEFYKLPGPLVNVAFSHLRSKEFRGYISHVYLTTGMHLNVHQCTLKYIPGIGVQELCWNNFGNNDGAKESRIIPKF